MMNIKKEPQHIIFSSTNTQHRRPVTNIHKTQLFVPKLATQIKLVSGDQIAFTLPPVAYCYIIAQIKQTINEDTVC